MEKMENQNFHLRIENALAMVGTATADFQVQPSIPGGIRSDWEFELFRAQRGRRTHLKSLPESVDSRNMPQFHAEYKDILPRVKELDNNVFRMSLDFARLCPNERVFDESLMAHYVRILARCHSLGIEPMVTLHHWPLPIKFCEYEYHKQGEIHKGGLEHPGIVSHFRFYVERVCDFLCNRGKTREAVQNEGYSPDFIDQLCNGRLLTRWFITLNEPVNMLASSYLIGQFPPYQKGRLLKNRCLEKKLRAMHRIADDTIRTAVDKKHAADSYHVRVGIAHNVSALSAENPFVKPFAAIGDRMTNWGLVERIEEGAHTDFLGLQYYFRLRLGLTGVIPPKDPARTSDHPDFGEIYPEGMYGILKTAGSKFGGKPLMVTEFGFSDKTDQKRPYWILETVAQLIRAKQEGSNIKGMLIWSLINNFEWNYGMQQQFGLYDAHGNLLPSDSGEGVSSRCAWKLASSHLRQPTLEKKCQLNEMRTRAKEQLTAACTAASDVEIPSVDL